MAIRTVYDIDKKLKRLDSIIKQLRAERRLAVIVEKRKKAKNAGGRQ